MKDIGRNIILVIIMIIVLFLLWFFSKIVIYILISYVLSLIGHPLVNIIEKIKIKTCNLPRSFTAFISLVVLWFFVFLFFRLFVPLITTQAERFSTIDVVQVIESLREPIQKIEIFIDKMNPGGEHFSIMEYAASRISGVLNQSYIADFFDSLAGILGDLFIAIIAITFITYYFLRDDWLFANTLLLFIPDEHEGKVRHILLSIKNLLSRYFVGICIESTLILIFISIGFKLIGFSWGTCLIAGLIAGVLNVIPYIGPLISYSFGMFICMLTYQQYDFSFSIGTLLGYATICYVIVKLIDDIIFQPYIYSSSVNAHPLEIFIIILLAANVAGVMGMLFAVPAYTIIRVIAKEFFSNFKLVKKITENI